MNVKSPASTNVTPPPNASIDLEATTASLVMVSVRSSLSITNKHFIHNCHIGHKVFQISLSLIIIVKLNFFFLDTTAVKCCACYGYRCKIPGKVRLINMYPTLILLFFDYLYVHDEPTSL